MNIGCSLLCKFQGSSPGTAIPVVTPQHHFNAPCWSQSFRGLATQSCTQQPHLALKIPIQHLFKHGQFDPAQDIYLTKVNLR